MSDRTIDQHASHTVNAALPLLPVLLYADRNGNAYRQQGGSWQKREGSQWSTTDRSKSHTDLDREQNARDRGNKRTSDYRSSRTGRRRR